MEALNRRFSTLVDVYSDSIAANRGRPFLGLKQQGAYEWVTFGAFAEMVDQARAGLLKRGLAKGDRVAVIADNCLEWAVMAFATYTAGGVYVPMYEAQKPKEWAFIVRDCEPSFVLGRTVDVITQLAPEVAGIAAVKYLVALQAGDEPLPPRCLTYHALCSEGREQPAPPVAVARDDLADLIYTSGTTGNPKGVMLTHANLADNISAFMQVTAGHVVAGQECSLAFLPWAHAFGQVAELYLAFAYGNRVALAESPQTLLQNLPEVRPTLLLSVPRVWNRVYAALHQKMADAGGLKKMLFDRAVAVAAKRAELAERGRRSPWLDMQFMVLDKLVFAKIREVLGGQLKFAISGAAALSPEVARFIGYLGIVVSEGYGLTESSPGATYNPIERPKVGTVGIPLPGVEIKIEPTETAPEGQGEIVIYGHNVMRGYYNRDAENKQALKDDGGLRSGDMGYIDDEGYIHITGRVKEQFKLENGKYVAPAPLEEQLALSPYIAQIFIHGANKAFVVALVVPDLEQLAKYVESQGHGRMDATELCKNEAARKLIGEELRRLSKEFKGFEKVRNFCLIPEEFGVENGMLTPTLKIKRRIVQEKYAAQLEALYEGPAAVAGLH